MDFALTTEQEELRQLTRRILTDRVPAPGDGGFDLDLWRTLAASGVAGVGLPESAGGGGGTFTDVCVVLEEIGRAAAPVPALAVMALAGPALVGAGRADELTGVADGDRVVTAALHEAAGDLFSPTTTAPDGRLTGTKICVPAGTIADRFVVSTTDGLYLVAAGAQGLTVERTATTSGLDEATLTFAATPAERLGGPDATDALLRSATAAYCVAMAGVAAGALDLTSAYVKERHQFDRAIATFQAVSQRAGDTYIDTEAVHLTAWHAAWRVGEGLDADAELAVAAYWAAEAGQRVVHAATHLHGGVGVDRAYPLAALFLWAKQIELALGGATPSLARLGRLLATQSVA
jgi:alkylation response protein AidB-like acyl-CoA dehydrogenase